MFDGNRYGDKLNLEERPCSAMWKKSTSVMFKLIIGLLMSIIYLPIVVISEVPSPRDRIPKTGECDLFSGEWVLSTSTRSYANKRCRFLSAQWNCMENGRPDSEYLYWRWSPYNCNLPLFNPKKFLNAMRDKSLAMIGDSLMRNQMQSLLCLLSEVEKSVHIYHGKAYGSMRWHFRSYNFTLTNHWAPFLLKAEFPSTRKSIVYLDTLGTWSRQYNKYDYIVIASGPWFSTPTILLENDTVVGCHSCKGEFTELGSFYLYRRALQMAFKFITTSDHKPLVVFRTWSPTHIKYTKRDSIPFCNRTTPYKEGEHHDTHTGHVNYATDMEEFSKAFLTGSKKGMHMRLLDIYHLSLLRPDGHPGPYTKLHPLDTNKTAKIENDCNHWCLPRAVDTWNDLMMEIMLNVGDTSLRVVS